MPYGTGSWDCLVVFCVYFEEALRMQADRANARSLGANNDVATVTAFPYLYFGLFEYLSSFNILQ